MDWQTLELHGVVMRHIAQFGKYRAKCRPRPGAYGVFFNERGHIVASLKGRKMLLPGGGLDIGETAYEACLRETSEETGFLPHQVMSVRALCRANQFCNPTRRGPLNKIGFFFSGHVRGNPAGVKKEPDHEPYAVCPVWFIREAKSPTFHKWAVLQALRNGM